MSTTLTIPSELPSDMLLAARIYRDVLGWAPHALRAPDDSSVPERHRGKRPIMEGWRSWRSKDATDSFLNQHFGNGSHYNLGIVVQGPLLILDIDSKEDGGASARRWLQTQEWLGAAPHEVSAGGFHVYLLSPDFPLYQPGAKPHGKALAVRVNDFVTVELFFAGTNVVVSPSKHRSGHQYRWEKTGLIPTVTWDELKQKIGFQLPEQPQAARTDRKPGRPPKTPPWHTAYKGDLRTLDLIGLCNHLGFYVGPINSEEHKHAVICPWGSEHSDQGESNRNDTSTAIFEPANDESMPGFCCLHAHCSERHLKEFLGWCEQKEQGVVDNFCKRQRVYFKNQPAEDGRPRVLLPGVGRPQGDFATMVGTVIGNKAGWFNKGEMPVEIQLKCLSEKVKCLVFHLIEPAAAVTRVEEYVQTGQIIQDEAGNEVFRACSMSEKTSRVLVKSRQLTSKLPTITRILPVQIPVFDAAGNLLLPKLGHDSRFQTYTDPCAPELIRMDLKAAKMWIGETLKDFPFDTRQSLTHAIARLITPACRGLMGWDARGPFWIFMANRERLGKDCLNGVVATLYDGFPNEDAPLEARNAGETRKRITAAIISGRARMHFANCRGHIQDAFLEQAITSRVWSDRLLGASTDITLPNELEFSMSGNLGVTYTPDIANRCRRIVLYFEGEDPNARKFSHPDIYGWVRNHRVELLSAVFALIEHWIAAGKPLGETAFASFPEWASIVGGIMQAAELGDPCLRDDGVTHVGGDEETTHMKELFRLSHEKWATERIELNHIIELITEED